MQHKRLVTWLGALVPKLKRVCRVSNEALGAAKYIAPPPSDRRAHLDRAPVFHGGQELGVAPIGVGVRTWRQRGALQLATLLILVCCTADLYLQLQAPSLWASRLVMQAPAIVPQPAAVTRWDDMHSDILG